MCGRPGYGKKGMFRCVCLWYPMHSYSLQDWMLDTFFALLCAVLYTPLLSLAFSVVSTSLRPRWSSHNMCSTCLHGMEVKLSQMYHKTICFSLNLYAQAVHRDINHRSVFRWSIDIHLALMLLLTSGFRFRTFNPPKDQSTNRRPW
jgi:hypothetical protein